MSLAKLIAAARLAGEASQGRRSIEMMVTEIGILVRGSTTVVPEARPTHLVPWAQLDSPADLASDAVVTVDRELSAMEGAA